MDEFVTPPQLPMKRVPDMGNHLIMDFVGVQTVNLNNYEELDTKLREVLGCTSVSIEGSLHKKFEPQGVTILYLLSESHFSIHTWPETKSCAIDFYHCGPVSNQNLAIAEERLCDLMGWENCTTGVLLQRGQTTSYMANNLMTKQEIFKNLTFVHREKSEYQDIRVYDSESMGRILVLDRVLQLATYRFNQDNYSAAMIETAIQKNREEPYEHVLIIGGGDLVIATKLLREYPNVRKVTVCEIDGRVVEVTKKYFSFADIVDKELATGRLEVVIESGATYMEKLIENEAMHGKLSAVIIDCTDFALNEDSLASELFTPDFYREIFQLLESGGRFSQ